MTLRDISINENFGALRRVLWRERRRRQPPKVSGPNRPPTCRTAALSAPTARSRAPAARSTRGSDTALTCPMSPRTGFRAANEGGVSRRK
jgi:hypothetical protein